jgi:hypothetical protein
MTTPSKPTKSELLQMLAEAVRNTQPQSVKTQPEVRDAQPDPKRKRPPRNTRSAPKRTAKIKSGRASARKRQPR